MKRLGEFFPAVKANQRLDDAWEYLEAMKREEVKQRDGNPYSREQVRLADLELFRALRRTGEFGRARELADRWVSEGWGTEQEQQDRYMVIARDERDAARADADASA